MTISFKERILKGLPPTDKMQETIILHIHYDIKRLFGYEPSDEGIKNLTTQQVHEITEIVKDESMKFFCYQNANFAHRYILNIKYS